MFDVRVTLHQHKSKKKNAEGRNKIPRWSHQCKILQIEMSKQ
jgi:hypothetical protein